MMVKKLCIKFTETEAVYTVAAAHVAANYAEGFGPEYSPEYKEAFERIMKENDELGQHALVYMMWKGELADGAALIEAGHGQDLEAEDEMWEDRAVEITILEN